MLTTWTAAIPVFCLLFRIGTREVCYSSRATDFPQLGQLHTRNADITRTTRRPASDPTGRPKPVSFGSSWIDGVDCAAGDAAIVRISGTRGALPQIHCGNSLRTSPAKLHLRGKISAFEAAYLPAALEAASPINLLDLHK